MVPATTAWPPANGRDMDVIDSEQRYSPLKQITADNVGKLGLAWYADLTERGQWQTTPVVVDGRIYVTTPWSKVYAFDAKTGKLLWKYDPKVPREIAGHQPVLQHLQSRRRVLERQDHLGHARWPPGRGRCEERQEGLGNADH